MNQYGDELELFVLYPEQPSSSNLNKCWNWFEPAHQRRGSGEPQVITNMVAEVKKKYSINSKQGYFE